jgi:hypothetical protein
MAALMAKAANPTKSRIFPCPEGWRRDFALGWKM